mmetsp:Transcript_57248/g.183963  ORF Transcript_57248/g.183963 Transcript_57248/m.183963 type:complete len:267 (-) Transcript_57248:75-875(-)
MPGGRWELPKLLEVLLWPVVLPWALFVGTLIVASCVRAPAPEMHPHVWLLEVRIDTFIRSLGPLLPLALLGVQSCCVPFEDLVKEEKLAESHKDFHRDFLPKMLKGQQAKAKGFLPEAWWRATMLVCLLATLGRLVFYMGVLAASRMCRERLNWWFSDHIFLVISILAMLTIQLVVLDLAKKPTQASGTDELQKRAVRLMVFNWLIIVMLLAESFVTVQYFHTQQAVWTAFLAGCACFGPAAAWWIDIILRAAAAGKASRQPLLQA